MLCGTILAPGRGLAVALSGVASGLARCIDGHAGDAGEAEESAAEPTADATPEVVAEDAPAESTESSGSSEESPSESAE